MPALLHVTLYSFCLGVSLIHLVFAAWSAEKGRQDWSRMMSGGKQYSLVLIEDGREYLRPVYRPVWTPVGAARTDSAAAYEKAYRFAIFRSVVAAVSAAYFCSHLVVRRVWKETWFIWCSVDFVIIAALAGLSVASQLTGMYFASAPAVLDIIAFFLLAIFYLILLISILIVFARGARREGARIALSSSVDRLKHVRRHGAPDPEVQPVAGQHLAPLTPEIRVTQV